jgi:lactose/L-arabinose transport system substrate-binding protein
LNKPTDAIETSTSTSSVPRSTFLKGAVATAAAVAATGLVTEVARAAKPLEVPNVNLGASLSGDVYLWDAQPLYTAVQVAAFNAAYPNIKVHQYVPKTPSLATHLITGINAPDAVFHMEDAYLGRFAPALYDVTEYVAPYVANIAPFKMAVCKQGGKTIAIPDDLCPAFLIYNTEIFSKAGVDPKTIVTYDNLIAAAKTIQTKVPTCKTPLFFLDGPDFLTFVVEGMAWQQHSGHIDASGKLNLKAPAYTNAFNYMEKVAKAGISTMAVWGTPDMYNMWNKGQVAMMHFADWFTHWHETGLKPLWGKIGLVKQPVFSKADSPYSVMGGSAWVVPAKAKRPDLGALLGTFFMLDPRGLKAAGNALAWEAILPAAKDDWAFSTLVRPIIAKSVNEHQLLVTAATNAPSSYRYAPWYADTFPYYGGAAVRQVLVGQLSGADGQSAAYNAIQSNVVARAR